MIVWNQLLSHSNSTKQMRENIRAAEEVAQTSKTEAEEARKKVEEEKRTAATVRRKAEEEMMKRLELKEEIRRLRAQFGVPEHA